MGTPTDIDARKFARVAKQRLEEAKTIQQKAQLPAAAEYLGGYAVECALKALLIVVTPRSERPRPGEATIDWLKNDFGHDLEELRRGLVRQRTLMPSFVAREFAFVATWDPQLRYEPGPGDPDRTERFLSAASAVLKWADERM